MGAVPVQFAKAIKASGGPSVAIETGTFKGDGTAQLMDAFDMVYTIEAEPSLADLAITRFGPKANVRVLLGDSLQVLPKLLNGLTQPAFLWLDAHSGMVFNASGMRMRNDTEDLIDSHLSTQCPLLGELRALREWHYADRSVIVIDDARAFLGPHLLRRNEADWPSVQEVFHALEDLGDRHITLHSDVIVSVPNELKPALHAWQVGDLAGRHIANQGRLGVMVRALTKPFRAFHG